jgi:hypothetical protein
MMSLNGLDKWSLDLKFQVEIVFGRTSFWTLECFGVPRSYLVVLRSSGGVAVL